MNQQVLMVEKRTTRSRRRWPLTAEGTWMLVILAGGLISGLCYLGH